MKCPAFMRHSKINSSLPVRGAWIEMTKEQVYGYNDLRRSPCGERGLKLKGKENP